MSVWRNVSRVKTKKENRINFNDMNNKGLRMILTILALIWIPFFVATVAEGAPKKLPKLTVAGVPVKGVTDKFIDKLYSAKFYVEGTKIFPRELYVDGMFSEETNLVGTWEGYRAVHLRVYAKPEDRTVGRVEAWLDAEDDWDKLLVLYAEVVDKERQKWGDPVDEAFLFDGQHGNLVNDTAKMLRLIKGTADVHSAWNMKDGSVRTEIAYRDGHYYILTKYVPQLFY